MKKIIFLCISSMLIAGTTSFKVDGMMCGVSCVNKLKAQVNLIEGVQSCDVSFEKSMMTVSYDESKTDGSKILNLFAEDPKYKVSAYNETGNAKSTKPCASSSNCEKPCDSNKKEKPGLFKRLFGWL